MKTNQAILLAIAAAAGAYYLGQRLKGSAQPEGPRPLPPLPEPDPDGPEGAGLGDVPSSWDTLDFDVDVFPPGASLGSLDPPMDESRWSVAEDCSAIALGHGVWERLRDAAQMHLDMDMGVEDTIAAVQQDVFSMTGPGGFGPKSRIMTCIESGSQAGKLLVREIRKRVRFMSGPWLTAGPQAGVPDAGGGLQPMGNPYVGGRTFPVGDFVAYGQGSFPSPARPSRRQPRVAQAVMYALGMR